MDGLPLWRLPWSADSRGYHRNEIFMAKLYQRQGLEIKTVYEKSPSSSGYCLSLSLSSGQIPALSPVESRPLVSPQPCMCLVHTSEGNSGRPSLYTGADISIAKQGQPASHW